MKQKFDNLVRVRYSKSIYRVLMIVLGLPTFLCAFLVWLSRRCAGKSQLERVRQQARSELESSGEAAQIREQITQQLRKQEEFFSRPTSGAAFERKCEKRCAEELEHELAERTAALMKAEQVEQAPSVIDLVLSALNRPVLLVLSVVTSLPFYILMLICANSIVRYMAERVVMMVFVMAGVVFVVFTILHCSPMDPATNILGEFATDEQLTAFNESYGLDKPYIVQLFTQIKNVFTLDMGNTFSGSEDVVQSILRKFPATMSLAVCALVIALVISIPIGVLSAIKPYTTGDYVFMFLAMVCLSLPVFWFGMVLILIFSINLGWLPSIFVEGEPLTYIMPSVVMGIHIVANLTRTTRSSMMEVIHEDYITTARAKGLSEFRVLVRHALTNALIPVITIIGLQVGSLLGGSSVSEKVFSVRGIGSYIVDKQMLPDIPAVLGAVVYLSIVIGIVNLLIDLIYTVIDPRIRSRIKNS